MIDFVAPGTDILAVASAAVVDNGFTMVVNAVNQTTISSITVTVNQTITNGVNSTAGSNKTTNSTAGSGSGISNGTAALLVKPMSVVTVVNQTKVVVVPASPKVLAKYNQTVGSYFDMVPPYDAHGNLITRINLTGASVFNCRGSADFQNNCAGASEWH